MPGPGPFELRSETVGSLPIVDHFLQRMGVAEHLEAYLPHDDARLRLAPAVVIGVVVRNIVVAHRPVYAIGEWATPYDPALLGLRPGDAAALNDDRVGRMLDRLFDADRASLVTETVLGVVRDFDVEVSQLHNDSTTVTLTIRASGTMGALSTGITVRARQLPTDVAISIPLNITLPSTGGGGTTYISDFSKVLTVPDLSSTVAA